MKNITTSLGIVAILGAGSLFAGGFGASSHHDAEQVQSSKQGIDVTYNTNNINTTIERPSDSSSKYTGQIGVGFTSYSYDKVNVYNIPLSMNIGSNGILTATMSYIKNDYTEKNGMGDSMLGYGYKTSFADMKSVTGVSIVLPTGDVKKGLGTDAYSYVISQSIKKDFDTFGLFGSFAYTFMGESSNVNTNNWNRKYDYGDRLSAFVGGYKTINKFLFKSKVIYYHAQADWIKTPSYGKWSTENNATYTDLDLNVGYEIAKNLYLAGGATIPIDDSHGNIDDNTKSRSNVYYFNLASKF
jgi:hypothetical protein